MRMNRKILSDQDEQEDTVRSRPISIKNKVKINVKFSLELATKAQRRSRGIALLFKPGARWGWVVNATPLPLDSRKRPGTHCTGGWVSPRDDLDGCGKSRPPLGSIPGHSSP
jgi:hypothetical protein